MGEDKTPTIALCLSGGGFRASLFHCGALRRLAELGILASVKTISTVSGGSIFAGFLATRIVEKGGIQPLIHDWESSVAAPFRAFTAKDLRTLPVLLHLGWNWLWPVPRSAHVTRLLKRRLTRLAIGQLPESPEFIFCATNMVFGVSWEFRRSECGDYKTGKTKHLSTWPLAKAVAASASFPPVFGPIQVGLPASAYGDFKYREKDREKLVKAASLTDGGVYDNLGSEPVLGEHDIILISDCGAPFEFSPGGFVPWRRLLRYTEILGSQVSALRNTKVFVGKTYKPCMWRLSNSVDDRVPGYSEELVNDRITAIRTDLDHFSEAEAMILENHGYSIADAVIAKRLPGLGNGAEFKFPHPGWVDEAGVRNALKDSHKRISLGRLWRGFITA